MSGERGSMGLGKKCEGLVTKLEGQHRLGCRRPPGADSKRGPK